MHLQDDDIQDKKSLFYLECMQEGHLGYKAIILFGILFGMRMQE